MRTADYKRAMMELKTTRILLKTRRMHPVLIGTPEFVIAFAGVALIDVLETQFEQLQERSRNEQQHS